MTIQIEVKDEVLQRLGEERLRHLIESKVKAEEFRLATDAIRQAMDEASATDVNWDAEFEQARQDAWEEYKLKHRVARINIAT